MKTIGKFLNNQIMRIGANFHNFLTNGGWIDIIVIAVFGIICASSGMITILIESYHRGPDDTFWFMVVIGAIVWSAAAFGICGIINIIRKHSNIFKL